MELRRIVGCMIFLLVAISTCSEARHSMQRRETDEANFDDQVLADAASDDDTQNDADGGDDDEEEPESNAVIVTRPESYNLTIGQSMRLQCKVAPDDARVVIQWSKDGVLYFMGKVKTNAPERFSVDSNSNDLLIRDLKVSDVGTYKCEILQTNGGSIEHTVHILQAPSIISFTASDKDPVEGSDLLLTCMVSGMPPPEIVWSRERNNVNERLTERDGEFTHNSVFIRNLRTDHSGKYYCYAFNRLNESHSELTITVAGKPRVHVHRTFVNSALNVEAVLQCSTHSHGPVHIRWYKNDRLIEDSSSQFSISTRFHNSNLTVTPSSDEDFGKFTCEAENKYGKHNRSIDLVQSPVVEDLDVDGPKLSWTVHSHQPLEEIELHLRGMSEDGQWQKIQVPLPENRAHEYELVYVLDEASLPAGRYEAVIKAKNQHSWSSSDEPAIVDIEARPEYIQHASVFRGSGHSLRPVSGVLLTLMYLLVRM